MKMTNTNHYVLVGNVTRDVADGDFAQIGNGSCRLNFTIAVNRSKKSGEQWIDEVSYIDFTCFGKVAENMKNLLNKGTKVCVSGYIKQDRWEKDGKKMSKIALVAESVELCSRKESETSSGAPVNNAAPNTTDGSDYPEDIPF